MRHLLLLALACSFAGASCETPNPLVRSCSGSQVQTAYFKVAGSCGDNGVITVTVASADSCLIGVLEPTGVGLPTVGSFGSAANTTNYELKAGNWNLNDPSLGIGNVGTFLSCTSGAAEASGEINFSCEQNVCVAGDSDDVECQVTACESHLTPTSADAGAIVPPPEDATIDGGS
jgi:hypothetical protein